MAKLTLSFKDRKLKVFGLQSGDCIIGRENDCTIAIDSLAVAPRHAQVRATGQSFVVEALDSSAHILINGQALNEPHELNEGDQIQIGKHTLSFSAESEGIQAPTTVTHLPRDAWLQILDLADANRLKGARGDGHHHLAPVGHDGHGCPIRLGGVDMTTSKPMEDVIALFGSLIDQTEELLES